MNGPIPPTRRHLLGAAGAAGTIVALTACSGGSSSEPPVEASEAPSPTGEGQIVLSAEELPESGKAEVTVKGPASGKDLGVLLYRVDASTVLAYSNVCTHQGCAVGTDTDEANFHCPCHGSRYAYEDGTVLGGPAPLPLTRYAAAIEGENILVFPPQDA
ncbi:ubiquinol-cytochrome c reductase iron-sulfur subunit [Glutamicibacter arilaitensis]|uniref:QcrA and Rieske domain-containing protein n=1 Tax=Glutamicibacter arilaitensis TaxID=256701 RepID=UPI0038500046